MAFSPVAKMHGSRVDIQGVNVELTPIQSDISTEKHINFLTELKAAIINWLLLVPQASGPTSKERN